MMVHFARSMADEIRASNEAGQPAGWILPVGLRRRAALDAGGHQIDHEIRYHLAHIVS